MRGVLDRLWNMDPTMKNNESDPVFIVSKVDVKDCESKYKQLDMHKYK